MAGNDAQGKAPTLEEEAAKFQGFAVQDGEVFDGNSSTAADARATAEAAERAAQLANSRSHKENQEAGATGNQPAKGKVELTEDEEATALQTATDKKGAVLTDEEADEVVGKALQDKERAAAKETRKKDVNSRMGELTRLRREAERREETTRRERDDLRRRLEALERGEKPAALTNDGKGGKNTSQDGKPDPTDAKYQYGELDAKYIADLARYETLQAIAEREEGKTKQQKSQQEAEAEAAFNEAKAAFEEAGLSQFDDFEEVVIATTDLPETDPGYWPLSQTMGELILDSDHGPAIAYQLASDPKEARKIFKLSAARQAAWFGVKEAEVSAGSAASSKTKQDEGEGTPPAEARRARQLPQPRNGQARESKAPLPLSKVAGAGGNRVPSEATTDFAAFEAMAAGTKK